MTDEPVTLAAASASTDTPGWRLPLARSGLSRLVTLVLLSLSAILFVLHFLHLGADFPNNSPWVDWSKYTDEGWYSDAAIRHYLSGHWYWKGDFNPAVALPVWPALELLVFRFTGVSPIAARALALCVFALTLGGLYGLIQRHTRPASSDSGQTLAAPLTVFLLCVSPFVYVFERMAILEPLLIALTVFALLTASYLQPLHLSRSIRMRDSLKALPPTFLLTLLLPAMVLTKTTAVCLLPAVGYMIWARAGYRLGPALRLGLIPVALGAVLWCAYFFFFVRPHYLADYLYLFSANADVGVEQPFASTVLSTLSDGFWMGRVLYISFFVVLALGIFWRPRLFANPLLPCCLLWIAGYTAFLMYHSNLQPRYYLVLAVPVTAVAALGLDFFRQPSTVGQAGKFSEPRAAPQIVRGGKWSSRTATIARSSLAATLVLAIAIPDVLLQLSFIRHPTYEFETAAQAIRRIVLADKTHPDLILSISGSDLTLMTGLPSIDDDYGTLELGQRVQQYRPGWFVTWNEVDDDKADALAALYSLQRIAAFPAMDDPDRNLLILYRLNPAKSSTLSGKPHGKLHTSKSRP